MLFVLRGKLLKIDSKFENLSGMAITLSNIGAIHYGQENFHEALEYFEKALDIDNKLGNLKGKAFRLRWIGSVYNKMNKKAEAINTMEEVLAIYKKLNLEWEMKSIQDTINRLKT